MTTKPEFKLVPGLSLGPFAIGQSHYQVSQHLAQHRKVFGSVDFASARDAPTEYFNYITVPAVGLRLHFRAFDQLLVKIDVLDFTRSVILFNNHKLRSDQDWQFRKIYVSVFPEEHARRDVFLSPIELGDYAPGPKTGVYVLAFSGLTISFHLDVDKWDPSNTRTAVLEELQASMMSLIPLGPVGDQIDLLEPGLLSDMATTQGMVDFVDIHGPSEVAIHRFGSESPFVLKLKETKMEDLTLTLSQPDSIYRLNGGHVDPTFSQPNSAGKKWSKGVELNGERMFFSYHRYGFDILVGPVSGHKSSLGELVTTNTYVALKMIIHSNIPRTFDFDRYHRCRWRISRIPNAPAGLIDAAKSRISSEAEFGTVFQNLRAAYRSHYDSVSEMDKKQMKTWQNRRWESIPSDADSIEIISGMDNDKYLDGKIGRKGVIEELLPIEFPGLIFELANMGQREKPNRALRKDKSKTGRLDFDQPAMSPGMSRATEEVRKLEDMFVSHMHQVCSITVFDSSESALS